ncbi:MAG: hypothetical protein PHE67_03610 [Campylobacterales bacterium]|nr:hypothetical protein [Campylobacterales bacterium]
MIISKIKEYAKAVKEQSKQDKNAKRVYIVFGVAFVSLVAIMAGIVLKIIGNEYSGYIFWSSMAIFYVCLFYIYWRVRGIVGGRECSECDEEESNVI